MEYTSFYGGRKGASFVIVNNYPDIPTMVTAFKEGTAYTAVNFDEYVLINTANKNHPDNGKVFRRGYDYNNESRKIAAYRAYARTTDQQGHPIADRTKEIIDGRYFDEITEEWIETDYHDAVYEYDDQYSSGGAIYVGTIVGPAGRAPHLHMATYDQVVDTHAGVGFEEQETHGSYTMDNGDLLPGKYEENETALYNDEIQWYCVSIRDNNNQDAEAYIGLKIPYPVIDFTTTAVAPYDQTGTYADTTAATRIDDQTHPFFEKWNISIPQGIKGDTLKNFRITVPNAEKDGQDNYRYPIYTVDTTNIYPGFEDDAQNNRQILVYDYYHYDTEDDGEPVTYYLGDYNIITNFTLADDGTVTLTYTHNDTVTYSKLVKWITNAYFAPKTITYQDGRPAHTANCILTFDFNTGEKKTFDLDWVQNLTIDQTGGIHVDHTSTGIQDLNIFIKWINNVSLAVSGNNQGAFEMSFNRGDPYRINLHWVKNISISDTGRVTLHYSTGTDADPMTYLLPSTWIKWIDNIQCDAKGIVTITYNTERTTVGTKDKTIFPNPIKWINAISWEEDGTVTVTYNTESTPGTPDQAVFSNAIKWVNDVRVIGDDEDTDDVGKLQIQYNYTEGEETPVYNDLCTIKYIKSIELLGISSGADAGKLKVVYNTKVWDQASQTYKNEFDLLNQKIKWINYITFSNDPQTGNGTLSVRYNDNTIQDVKTDIKFITNVSLNNQTGILKVVYNGNEAGSGNYITNLQWPVNLSINTRATGQTSETDPIGYTGNQKLHVQYTPDENGVPRESDIGNPLNYILKAKVTEDDHHLIILYSDPQKRNAGPKYHNGQAVDNYENWTDLGPVTSDKEGVLVGLNYTWLEVYESSEEDPSEQDPDQAIAFLNENFPQGLTNKVTVAGKEQDFIKDKIVTVGNPDDNKFFFGFDYTIIGWTSDTPAQPIFKKWYFIGQLAPADSTVSVALSQISQIPPAILPDKSLWFVIEKICDVTYNLTNVTSTNKVTKVKGDGAYVTTLTPQTDNENFQVTVQKNDNDVWVLIGSNDPEVTLSNNVYLTETKQIYISSLSNDIRITAISD